MVFPHRFMPFRTLMKENVVERAQQLFSLEAVKDVILDGKAIDNVKIKCHTFNEKIMMSCF